ncbi:hypothetical protein MUK42_27388 [Musa troglodytarum]|uniref:Uncharacterized protein n=1 Tax=Musa troglodytarum TaxID=320322 RepID=A0A9E7FJK5_9LILI|nr:hypothetical protein MUK42_27388 [Musa troglodytarum]URD97072.1 hypothetical protein MUK42_27388 [Musa troglodytarum]URD97073.1 hypothetical protein MUK42_27388 [Musa troglodytarum]URD97074.1 hypothetical protein MUK42_27388 [Musa troglodytarum]
MSRVTTGDNLHLTASDGKYVEGDEARGLKREARGGWKAREEGKRDGGWKGMRQGAEEEGGEVKVRRKRRELGGESWGRDKVEGIRWRVRRKGNKGTGVIEDEVGGRWRRGGRMRGDEGGKEEGVEWEKRGGSWGRGKVARETGENEKRQADVGRIPIVSLFLSRLTSTLNSYEVKKEAPFPAGICLALLVVNVPRTLYAQSGFAEYGFKIAVVSKASL